MATRHRNYEKEYKTYQGTPEQIKKRAERNKARREMEKKVGAAAIKGKDIDHKKPLDRGGSNAMSNLRISSVKANRNWRKGKSGYNA
jgi:5-methylcytosine-specific restriction endonuclease McrA